MRLIEIIPQSETVNAMAPEELAAVMLRHMNQKVKQGREKNLFHPNNYCNGESREYTSARQHGCEQALSTAWMHLMVTGMLSPDVSQLNHWCLLTPRALAIKDEADYEHFRKAALYPRGSIHPTIEQETFAEFLRGDYETAVFKAFKAIEVAVRPPTGAPHNVVGRDLMVKAFQPDTGALRDASEVTAERESLMELFRGAVGRFKNPTSHREVDFDEPAEVLEILQLASLLMRIVDRRVAARAAESRVG